VVLARATQLGMSTKRRRWSPEEIEILNETAGTLSKAAIARKLSQSVEYFVVQGNESTIEHEGELRRLASIEFLSKLLRENGFPDQRILRFTAYDRPLVIGRSRRAA